MDPRDDGGRFSPALAARHDPRAAGFLSSRPAHSTSPGAYASAVGAPKPALCAHHRARPSVAGSPCSARHSSRDPRPQDHGAGPSLLILPCPNAVGHGHDFNGACRRMLPSVRLWENTPRASAKKPLLSKRQVRRRARSTSWGRRSTSPRLASAPLSSRHM